MPLPSGALEVCGTNKNELNALPHLEKSDAIRHLYLLVSILDQCNALHWLRIETRRLFIRFERKNYIICKFVAVNCISFTPFKLFLFCFFTGQRRQLSPWIPMWRTCAISQIGWLPFGKKNSSCFCWIVKRRCHNWGQTNDRLGFKSIWRIWFK